MEGISLNGNLDKLLALCMIQLYMKDSGLELEEVFFSMAHLEQEKLCWLELWPTRLNVSLLKLLLLSFKKFLLA
jgi:hypothetical protein